MDADAKGKRKRVSRTPVVIVADDDEEDDNDADDTDYDDIEDDQDDDKATVLRKKQKKRLVNKWTFKAKESIRQVQYFTNTEDTISYFLKVMASVNGLLLCDTRSKKSQSKKDTSLIGKGGNNDLHTDIKMLVIMFYFNIIIVVV